MITNTIDEDMAHNDYGGFALNALQEEVMNRYHSANPVSAILQVTTRVRGGTKQQKERARAEILGILLPQRLVAGVGVPNNGPNLIIPYQSVARTAHPKFFFTTSSWPEPTKMEYMRVLISDLNNIIAQQVIQQTDKFVGVTQATVVFMLSKPLDFLQAHFVSMPAPMDVQAAAANAAIIDESSD
jgi:hypothetical protein